MDATMVTQAPRIAAPRPAPERSQLPEVLVSHPLKPQVSESRALTAIRTDVVAAATVPLRKKADRRVSSRPLRYDAVFTAGSTRSPTTPRRCPR